MGEKGDAVCFVISYVPMSYLVYRKVKPGSWSYELRKWPHAPLILGKFK